MHADNRLWCQVIRPITYNRITKQVCSYPDWCISLHANRRHRPSPSHPLYGIPTHYRFSLFHIVTVAIFNIFHVKKYSLDFWPLKVIQIQIWRCQSKAHGCFQKVIPRIQPRISHRFKDVLNQRIVTLTYNLSRTSKVKLMGSQYNPR